MYWHKTAFSLGIVWGSMLSLLTVASLAVASEAQDLPSLGDSTSGIISLQQERELGQEFLRSIRASDATLDDPILQNYLEHLIYKLASHSQLEDRRIDLAIIKDAALNAFAAPGGIVGVNYGLFSYAETEHEISAILSHELAHLSQRHFARQLVSGKKSGLVGIAGLLAGIILMSTTGSDAGLAAMAGSQAYGQTQFLKYNREREAEADRIGIDTLAESGMDPRAMAYMFERLQNASKYSTEDRIPEFLRTHPVTNSRIADAYNQTSQYPRETYQKQLDYQLMRARARAITATSVHAALHYFTKELESNKTPGSEVNKKDHKISQTANQYGLLLTRTRELDIDDAKSLVAELRDAHPYNMVFRIAEADIYKRAQQHDVALTLLDEALSLSPNNYPLSVAYGEALIAAERPQEALHILSPLSIKRPNDEYIWYLLAEAYGLADNIPGVHEARAEFFVLNGNFKQALKQLDYALPLVRNDFQQSARIQQRMEVIKTME